MYDADFETRRMLQQLGRPALQELQLCKLNLMLEKILPDNGFYAHKLDKVELPLRWLDTLSEIPFTCKSELSSGQDDLAVNRTWPVDRYARFHRTSGTHGRPMVVLDTADDWNWWIQTWQFVLDAANVTPHDRAMMAFSFGPFIGFWSAYDALVNRNAMVVPSGGMSTLARLELLQSVNPTIICCTPTYALHMAEVASANDVNISDSTVSRIIVAGEPGGSVPSVRERIESAWNATVIDHSGATEIGPCGYADKNGRGLHVVESEFIAEFISLDTGDAAGQGELAELVLTSLGRFGSPVIRYRTGDLVRPVWDDNQFVLLEGGILGRVDDMMVIRGVNVFPSSVEQIIRGFPEIVEFRLTAFKTGEMDSMRIEIEDPLGQPERVARELQLRLGLRVDVSHVPVGSLPRFEAKGRRFVDERNS